jgi:hypothetical protein
LLDAGDSKLARQIGLAARLGFAISASAAGELPRYGLRLSGNRIVLEVARRREAMAGDPVQKRLSALAQAMGIKGEIAVA